MVFTFPMKTGCFPLCLAMLGLTGNSFAIRIEVRYDHDTLGFFNRPGARAAMEAVARFYEPLLHDSLAAIRPSDWPGMSWTATFTHPGSGASGFGIPGLEVPADTLVIFAGARPMGSAGIGGSGGYSASGNQAWFDLISARGQSGALASPATDFGPWGGSISFDSGRSWNFSLTDPDAPGVPFIPIALHEIAHVLGIGVAPSWNARISGSHFTGPHAVQAYGGNVPLSGNSHWRDNICGGTHGYLESDPNKVLSKAYGSFGALHGHAQIGLMDPTVCTSGIFHKVMTDLDLAALRDIGWEFAPPLRLEAPNLRPSSPFTFSWPSTSGFTYRLQRSPSLSAGSWTNLTTVAGNGSVLQFTTTGTGASAAFYRLNTHPVVSSAARRAAAPRTFPAPRESPPVDVEGCHCGP